MKIKEIKIIILLSLLVSIIINIALITNTSDFSIFRLLYKSNGIIKAYQNSNLEVVRDSLYYSDSDNVFIERKNSALENIGGISDYKLYNVFDNFHRKGAYITVKYLVRYTSSPSEWNTALITFKLENSKWKLSSCEFNKNGELIHSIAEKEEGLVLSKANVDVNKAKGFSESILYAYIDNRFSHIYENLDTELTAKSKEDFQKYLLLNKKNFGSIKHYQNIKVDVSKNGDEFKFTYSLECENYKGKLAMIIWTKSINGELKVSGLNFVENVW